AAMPARWSVPESARSSAARSIATAARAAVTGADPQTWNAKGVGTMVLAPFVRLARRLRIAGHDTRHDNDCGRNRPADCSIPDGGVRYRTCLHGGAAWRPEPE